MDDVPLIGTVLRRQVDETALEDEAALVLQRPVHLARKHDQKEFAYSTTTVNAKRQPKTAPLHNPTCKLFSLPNGCKHGDKCLSPHRERGGLMAVRSPLTKREASIEQTKHSDASTPAPKAKAKAKVKVKAKAKAAKVPAGVLLTKDVLDTK